MYVKLNKILEILQTDGRTDFKSIPMRCPKQPISLTQ